MRRVCSSSQTRSSQNGEARLHVDSLFALLHLLFTKPGWFIIVLSLFSLVPSLLATSNSFILDPAVLDAAEEKYGAPARTRLLAWQNLVQSENSLKELAKLEKVNDFFNQFAFVSDAVHWQKKDYWATPIEFLASKGGDCEDFALAKYFTLKKLGIEEAKLNMTYVKAWQLNQAHMVVTYYETPASEPLVLDNLVKKIEPASKRTDLLPVFSFNGSSLWISKERGRGNMVGKSDRLALWNDLLKRMPDSLK